MKRLLTVLLTFVLVTAFSGLLMAQAKSKTLDNLMAAFNGESNAAAKYLEFAKKADAEGYGAVASLFRAASKAEDIHARTHAATIKLMGGTPKADIKLPAIKTTKENLQAALEGETYEKETMYPGFLKQAKLEKNNKAIRAFNYARTAEIEHAKFYTEALANLAAWKGGKKDFFVCGVCGYTVAKITFEKCPSCFEPISNYSKVN